MDFNRPGHPRPTNVVPGGAPAPQRPAAATTSSFDNFKQSQLYRWGFLALLVSATILFVAMIFFIAVGRPLNREARYVAGDKYQAVFVNVSGTSGGQVYFGNVTALTPQYIKLSNVFYIQNQQTTNNQTAGAYNLVKLGCELHGPQDEMIINRDQVFFWENLKSDGQVAQKIEEFKKQNPNGQKCSTTSGSTQQSSGTTQGATTTSPTPEPTTAPATTPTPTPTTPTKKP